MPNAAVRQGGITTLYVTGIGEVSPALKTAYSPPSGTSVSSLPRPLLPFSVTVGGVPAFLQYVGISPGLIGTAQVNFTVPASVPPGLQPVVVTVGGASSPAVNLMIQPPQ